MSFENVFKTTYEKSIYINRLMFDHECDPHEFKHRDNETTTIAEYIKPLLKNDKPKNAIIQGAISTGKTTAMKKIIELIEKTTQKIACAYINCEIHTSKREIYKKINQELFGITIDQNRISTPDIQNNIGSYLQKNKKGLIVVLDEVDKLFENEEIKEIITSLLTTYEEYMGVRIGLYLVSSQTYSYYFDEKIKTLLAPKEVYFKDYTKEQVYEILHERCELGFVKGAITDQQLKEIVNYSVNIRDGLSILLDLGDMAEKEGSISIKDEYLDLILEKLIK